jgi:hypothetical protein
MSSQLQNWKDDLNDGAVNVGNVRSQVIAALDAAWQHVHNRSRECGVDELDQAAEALQNAIDVLTYTRKRIKKLREEEFAVRVASWDARQTA